MPAERGTRPSHDELEAILREGIQDGLRSVLGQSGLQMVLKECPLELITAEPARFHEFLKGIFMEGGALVIEREIGRRLLQRLGDEFDPARHSRHRWLVAATTRNNGSARVSKEEREVLRRFLSPEPLPKERIGRANVGAAPIEVTAASFARAFKKGT